VELTASSNHTYRNLSVSYFSPKIDLLLTSTELLPGPIHQSTRIHWQLDPLAGGVRLDSLAIDHISEIFLDIRNIKLPIRGDFPREWV
jgi:hypothetical protein